MRVYMFCLLVRPLTYGSIVFAVATLLLGWWATTWLTANVPNVPDEVIEGIWILFLIYVLMLPTAALGVAWESRRIYLRIYPYILRDGPDRYWAVTRFHGGCSYTAFRLAEYDTRMLRAQNPVPQ